MSEQLSKDRIEHLREFFHQQSAPECNPAYRSPSVDALCDMATAFLDQGAQEAVGRLVVKQAQLEYDCSEKVGAKYISAIAYASSEASDLPIGEYLLYTRPAPTAEIIEALRYWLPAEVPMQGLGDHDPKITAHRKKWHEARTLLARK